MSTVRFIVPGLPKAKQRHRTRVMKLGERFVIRHYDPPSNKKYVAIIREHWLKAESAQGVWDESQPATVEIVAVYPCQRPLKKSKRPREWRTKKPDVDNIAKIVMDALTDFAWHDDSQVCSLSVSKIQGKQGEPARMVITVSRPTKGDLENAA